MNGLWGGIAAAQDSATAASGIANAAYFARQSGDGGAIRRAAALVLVGLCGGAALLSAYSLATTFGFSDGDEVEVLVRLPLLLGNLATLWLITSGDRP